MVYGPIWSMWAHMGPHGDLEVKNNLNNLNKVKAIISDRDFFLGLCRGDLAFGWNDGRMGWSLLGPRIEIAGMTLADPFVKFASFHTEKHEVVTSKSAKKRTNPQKNGKIRNTKTAKCTTKQPSTNKSINSSQNGRTKSACGSMLHEQNIFQKSYVYFVF